MQALLGHLLGPSRLWSAHPASAAALVGAARLLEASGAALQRAIGTTGLACGPTGIDTAASGTATATAAGAPASVPVHRLQSAITPPVCEHLRQNGFAVIDGVFGEETAAALRAEVAAARQHMHKNCTHLVHGGSTRLLEKEHIWEAELMLPETQALTPLCSQLQHDSTLRVMLSLLMPELSLQEQAIKLQWNEGQGGCFPIHFDTDATVDARRVTAIWYLNPGWKQGDGGELRLYPFPKEPVDVAPLNDRMVLFSSRHMLHRVLPSRAERYCFTIWLSEGALRRARGSSGGGSGPAAQGQGEGREELRRALSSERPLGTDEAWRLLLHPEIRQHAAKLRHCIEWEQSIRESHPEGPALQQALQTFHREVAVVARALAPLLPALAAGLPAGGSAVPRPPWF